ncbi:hypothetical protein KL933_003558 [Ogataea haglerorum]|uniref:Uncharacterized protein n=1 Tax=Ogataea haglerorum TaxID=1937702 RepID=A0AAN6D4Y1_9ASCO|nr:hypothetical protein KL915_003589 [Ogataea haglerorum]KAG7705042.1 hypothetical protein KL914_003728 [Ogataea haglerorum]KAG7705300.1 hypothetical protein KL950_003736 [Ogataea haglerorum]KAG7726116.1 hypothetical protein KL933_003558 [Ogataea haglerorum]KAG7729644.1 hypothetical protein KL948_003798 [Ogataea haglerorum]
MKKGLPGSWRSGWPAKGRGLVWAERPFFRLMFDDLSLQKDDRESLNASAPVLEAEGVQRYLQMANFKLHRCLDRHNESFRDFWKLDEIPDKNSFFYHHFPKVATNHDNEHHVSNFGIFLSHFYLGRWLPDTIQKLLFPIEPVEQKLSAKNMPTIAECRLCESLQGLSVWTRTGEWFCVDRSTQLHSSDELGERFFSTYGEYCRWRKTYSQRLRELEQQAYELDDFDALEKELQRLEKLCFSAKVDADTILSIKRG